MRCAQRVQSRCCVRATREREPDEGYWELGRLRHCPGEGHDLRRGARAAGAVRMRPKKSAAMSRRGIGLATALLGLVACTSDRERVPGSDSATRIVMSGVTIDVPVLASDAIGLEDRESAAA